MCVLPRPQRSIRRISRITRPALGGVLAAKDSVISRPCPQFHSVAKNVSRRGISAAAGLEKSLVTRTELYVSADDREQSVNG